MGTRYERDGRGCKSASQPQTRVSLYSDSTKAQDCHDR